VDMIRTAKAFEAVWKALLEPFNSPISSLVVLVSP